MMIGTQIGGAAIDAVRPGAVVRLENRQSFSWMPIILADNTKISAHIQQYNE